MCVPPNFNEQRIGRNLFTERHEPISVAPQPASGLLDTRERTCPDPF